MNIIYIPLGSFCYPKMIIRETNRELQESLPFDFHSSPHLDGITNILKDLYYNKTYDLDMTEIIDRHNTDELTIKEKNLYVVHYFKDKDLINSITSFPVPINYINENKLSEVNQKLKKRFERLYDILNNTNNILCFLRIENYKNYGWKYELDEFTKILSLFKNPNKFLIYSQELIDKELHFNNSQTLNYDYHIPILFYKHYFYDLEMINNKDLFISILKKFEYTMENNILNIKNIKKNNIIEKFYYDKNKYQIFKLTNINLFSNAFLDNNILYIINVLDGIYKYVKNDNIFEFDSIVLD
jgi:hypothetical protein